MGFVAFTGRLLFAFMFLSSGLQKLAHFDIVTVRYGGVQRGFRTGPNLGLHAAQHGRISNTARPRLWLMGPDLMA